MIAVFKRKKRPHLELGVLQNQIKFIDGFPRYGCYVACIATGIQRSIRREMTAQEFLEWFNDCVQKNYIRHNDVKPGRKRTFYRCFVVDRVGAFNLGMERFNVQRRACAPSDDKPAHLRIYQWRTRVGHHFTYGSLDAEKHDPCPAVRRSSEQPTGFRDMHVYDI